MMNEAAGDFAVSNLNIEEDESTIDNLTGHGEQMAQTEKAASTSAANPRGKAGLTTGNISRLLKARAFIQCMDADQVFIVTAENTSDRAIQVWDIESGECVQLLTGHIGPITGVKLQLDNFVKPDGERIVISASEDGTIRQWSVESGIELRKLTTANLITCMETLGRSLVVTGNHRGVLEVYHQLTGQLYAKEIAHTDAIDALLVRDNHICTAVYNTTPANNSLKVWTMKWGKMVLAYAFHSDFRPFALNDNDFLVMGSVGRQELRFFDLTSDITYDTKVVLHQTPGCVTAIGVAEELVFAATSDGSDAVHLHVYQEKGFKHIITHQCKDMDVVSKITATRSGNRLKFVLGGSALATLELDFAPEKEKEVYALHKDSEKILNVGKSEEENDLTRESPNIETLDNEEDTVTSSSGELNIEPLTPSRKTDKVTNLRDNVKHVINLPPLDSAMVERTKSTLPTVWEKTTLNNFEQVRLKKNHDSESDTLLSYAEEKDPKNFLDEAAYRNEARFIKPRVVKKVAIQDMAEGDARQEASVDGELSGMGAGGEEPPLVKNTDEKEVHPDCTYDVGDGKSGFFRNFRMKRQDKRSKSEQRADTKCNLIDPEKILNVENIKGLNNLTKESPNMEKSNNEEVTSQATTSSKKLNIEETDNRKTDNVKYLKDGNVEKLIRILERNKSIVPTDWDSKKTNFDDNIDKIKKCLLMYPPSDPLSGYTLEEIKRARCRAFFENTAMERSSQCKKHSNNLTPKKTVQISQSSPCIAQMEGPKAILDEDEFRHEAQFTEPRRTVESSLEVNNFFLGDRGGLVRKVVRKEAEPDCVSDISVDKSGCFQKFRRERRDKRSKSEQRGNKKCNVM